MGDGFRTLQEFMTHTKALAYIIMAGALVAIPMFWRFLTERDDGEKDS